MVSQRSADISDRLAADFPQVIVSSDNQAIVDGCDTVVLAIRPQIAERLGLTGGLGTVCASAAADSAAMLRLAKSQAEVRIIFPPCESHGGG